MVVSGIVKDWVVDHLILGFILFGILPYFLGEGFFKGWHTLLEFSIMGLLYDLLLCLCFFLGSIMLLWVMIAIEYPAEIIARCVSRHG